MAKEKLEFAALLQYLPEASYELVLQYIVTHKVQLTITRSRTTVLGNYRHAHANKGHRISVNGDLNKYAFLITLLHEIAHLITFETHGNKVAPHGQEWKYQFGKILSTFLEMQFFPLDIKAVLLKLRVLKNYDENKDGIFFVEQILLGDKFKIKGNRVFEKGEKIRKRFKCKEIATGKWYLFSPISEVIRVA
ncbi:MAG: SprT-like domain-containing protein [Ferruginibacter sp.]